LCLFKTRNDYDGCVKFIANVLIHSYPIKTMHEGTFVA